MYSVKLAVATHADRQSALWQVQIIGLADSLCRICTLFADQPQSRTAVASNFARALFANATSERIVVIPSDSMRRHRRDQLTRTVPRKLRRTRWCRTAGHVAVEVVRERLTAALHQLVQRVVN